MRRLTRLLGALHWVRDEPFLRWAYRLETGRAPELGNPRAFTEKLQWLKLRGGLQRFAPWIDKVTARGLAAKALGRRAVMDRIAVYSRVEQIDWLRLAGYPDGVVLKCAHGSHCACVYAPLKPYGMAREEIERRLKRWMRRDWYWVAREPQYRGLKPRIIAEPYVPEAAATDYKVMCFGGRAEVIQVHGKHGGQHTLDFFDRHGLRVDMRLKGYPLSWRKVLDGALSGKLIEAAERVAAELNTPYARVDLYVISGVVQFGEVTLCDSAGFGRYAPEGIDRWLGNKLALKPMACPVCGKEMHMVCMMGAERVDKCDGCGHLRRRNVEVSS